MNTTVSVYTIDIWHATLTGLPYSILKAPPSLRFAKYGYYNPSSPSFCLQGGSNSLELKLSRLSIAVNLAKLFKRRKLWNATRNVVLGVLKLLSFPMNTKTTSVEPPTRILLTTSSSSSKTFQNTLTYLSGSFSHLLPKLGLEIGSVSPWFCLLS